MFEVGTAKDFAATGLDLVTFFDCLHDMGDPTGAAAHVRRRPRPGRQASRFSLRRYQTCQAIRTASAPNHVTLVTSAMMLLLNLLLGADFPGIAYFISPVVTALLWGPVNWLLYMPVVRRRRGDSAS